MRKVQKIRRTRIDGGYCEAKPRWMNSTLIFRDYRGDEGKEVIVTVEDPWTIMNIREQLDKITAHWADELKRVRTL